MSEYVLLDSQNTILKTKSFPERPGDPVGKGWRWVPLVYDADPVYDGEVERLSQYTTVVEADQVRRYKTVEQIPVTNALINKERERRIGLGTNVNVANAVFPVDTDTLSMRNIQGLGSAGTLRLMTGDTTTLTSFRDANNVNRDLTPQDVVNLAMTVAAYIKTVYNASWAIKDDVENYPANLKALRNDPRWP